MRSARILAILSLFAPVSHGGGAPVTTRPAGQPGDSAAVAMRARASADAFVELWRYYWEVSEQYRHGALAQYGGTTRGKPAPPIAPPHGVQPAELSSGDSASVEAAWVASRAPGYSGERGMLTGTLVGVGGGVERTRVALLLCEVQGFASVGLRPFFAGYVIPSSIPRRAVCPTWYLGDSLPPWDESKALDNGIISQLRPAVVAARAAMLGQLDSANAAVPGDDWVTGQRVRFALDQGDTADAWQTVDACRATQWWCTALDGYLIAQGHNVPKADSAFGAMLLQMPPVVRCEWTDLSALLDAAGQRAYAPMSCARRDSVNTRIWWLSDPLYMELGNERRVEHYAREVLVRLRGGTDINERWDMRDIGGGTAITKMLVRYGWPTFSYWGGEAEDEVQFVYLGAARAGPEVGERLATTLDPVAHGRFATAEYGPSRIHTVPSWEAISHSDSAQESDWDLSASAHQSEYPASTGWWPEEHYERTTGPIVSLWTQRGVFRRQNNALLAMGMDVPSDAFAGAVNDTLRGELVLSTGPDSMDARPTQAIVGHGSSIRAVVASRPQVISLELFGLHPAGVAARTRFGIDPPPPLSAMRPGEIAIVPPVLVRPPLPGEAPPTDPDGALARMHGPVISDWTHVGFYWETYGVKEGDTVDIAMQFERHDTSAGFLRRLGYHVGIGQEASGIVTFKWREPDPGHEVLNGAGPVPIQGRNVTLDLSQLGVGEYTLVVSVARPGGTPVTASRPFWIEKD